MYQCLFRIVLHLPTRTRRGTPTPGREHKQVPQLTQVNGSRGKSKLMGGKGFFGPGKGHHHPGKDHHPGKGHHPGHGPLHHGHHGPPGMGRGPPHVVHFGRPGPPLAAVAAGAMLAGAAGAAVAAGAVIGGAVVAASHHHPPQRAVSMATPDLLAASPAPMVLTVSVPAGVGPGMALQIQAPDGQLLQVVVPPGLIPGQSFQVAYRPL